jgi:hypothetical protein
VAPPGGSSSSLLLGGWAMDHFLKPSAPLAFREIVIIAIHFGELVWKRIWEGFVIILDVQPLCWNNIPKIIFERRVMSFLCQEIESHFQPMTGYGGVLGTVIVLPAWCRG